MNSVNVYDFTRSYGGPEEGGWYYDAWSLVASHPIRGALTSDKARKQLNRFRVMYGFTPSTAKRFQNRTAHDSLGYKGRRAEYGTRDESRIGGVDSYRIRLEPFKGSDGDNWQPWC